MNKNDINTPRPIYSPSIYQISKENFISIQLMEKRGNRFYDIIFNNKVSEHFIGRYQESVDNSNIRVSYNDGKILVYFVKFIKEVESVQIVKVETLYDILDDCIISCTEEEAVNIFDNNLNSTFLKNKQNYLHQTDLERIKKLRI